jgi:hypothetical protein
MAKQADKDWRRQVVEQMLPTMEATTEQATGFTPAPANPQPFSVGMHLQPPFDPIEQLAHIPAAAEKMRLLGQRSDDQHAVIPEFETVRAASMRKIEAANALKRLTDHPQDGGFGLKDDDRRVLEAQRTLDKDTREFELIKQRSEDRTAAWRTTAAPVATCADFLRHGVPGNCKLEAVEVQPPKLNKGETVTDAIEHLRRRGRELKADLHRIQSAPYPSSYAERQMIAQVEALAMQGAPSVSLLIEHDGKIVWQTQQMQSTVYNAQPRAVAFTEVPDAVALVAWLHKDALIAALGREIASEADDKAALTHEARQKAEAETMGDLLAVERDESWFVWQAQSQGLPVEHRPDISPLALLGVRLVTTPRVTEAPETSRGFHGRCGDEPDRAAGAACVPATYSGTARARDGRLSRATPITNRAAGRRLTRRRADKAARMACLVRPERHLIGTLWPTNREPRRGHPGHRVSRRAGPGSLLAHASRPASMTEDRPL